MLTRRDVLQRAGTASALVTTASWWLVRRAHAARQHKLIVWVPTALAPQVDKILQSSVSLTPSRQASKTTRSTILFLVPAKRRPNWSRRLRPATHQTLPTGQSCGAPSLPGASPGGDRHCREDAESPRWSPPSFPQRRDVQGKAYAVPQVVSPCH